MRYAINFLPLGQIVYNDYCVLVTVLGLWEPKDIHTNPVKGSVIGEWHNPQYLVLFYVTPSTMVNNHAISTVAG